MEELNQLFERWKGVREDIKFTKKLQWNNIYYAILLYVVNTGAYNTIREIPGLFIIMNFVILITTIFFQYKHFNYISNYQREIWAIENMIDPNMKIEREIRQKAGTDYENLKNLPPKEYSYLIIPTIINILGLVISSVIILLLYGV